MNPDVFLFDEEIAATEPAFSILMTVIPLKKQDGLSERMLSQAKQKQNADVMEEAHFSLFSCHLITRVRLVSAHVTKHRWNIKKRSLSPTSNPSKPRRLFPSATAAES